MSDSEYSDEWDEEESYESAGGGAQLAGEYEPPISSSRGKQAGRAGNSLNGCGRRESRESLPSPPLPPKPEDTNKKRAHTLKAVSLPIAPKPPTSRKPRAPPPPIHATSPENRSHRNSTNGTVRIDQLKNIFEKPNASGGLLNVPNNKDLMHDRKNSDPGIIHKQSAPAVGFTSDVANELKGKLEQRKLQTSVSYDGRLQQTNGGGSIKKVSHEFGSVDRRKKVAPAPSSSSTKLRMTHSEQHIPVVVVAPMKTANKPPHEQQKIECKQPWFHGSIDRTEAERRLLSKGANGTFLVRVRRKAAEIPFALSLLYENHVYHTLVRKKPDGKLAAGKTLKPNEPEFDSIEQLVDYYRKNNIYVMSKTDPTDVACSTKLALAADKPHSNRQPRRNNKSTSDK